MINQYISIDEEGFPSFGDLRVQDPSVGREIFENLFVHEANSLVTVVRGEKYIVESFDEPYVAQMVSVESDLMKIQLPYGTEATFDPMSLSVDEWDRFHGYAKYDQNLVPFVMSRKAQAEFFRLADEYDDDGITFNGQRFNIPPYWQSQTNVHSADFWSLIYKTENTPGWDLGQAHSALQDMLPRLKLAKSRVLVLGCGAGHDAAYFAQAGHLVTAVDHSEEAMARGKKLYGHLENIQWLQADAFQLPKEMSHSYDIVFEHTCFCAIDPARRQDLVQTWMSVLAPGGFLMGVFFAMEKRAGPPFGGSEWELRQRLRKDFQFLFWGRWHQSPPSRHGKEFFVYARKL
jgi:SAM-dependent methyltransferase